MHILQFTVCNVDVSGATIIAVSVVGGAMLVGLAVGAVVLVKKKFSGLLTTKDPDTCHDRYHNTL